MTAMARSYERPIIEVAEGLSEGVFMASGGSGERPFGNVQFDIAEGAVNQATSYYILYIYQSGPFSVTVPRKSGTITSITRPPYQASASLDSTGNYVTITGNATVSRYPGYKTYKFYIGGSDNPRLVSTK